MVSRKTQAALDHIQVWSTRVNHLPVGALLTNILLEVSKDLNNRLAMAMAVSRFIEHVSFVGYTRFPSAGNMFESVEPLNLPPWIVNLRHEAIHGQLPNIHNLRAGFENCYAWIVLNYWQIERIEPIQKYDRLSSLLDLYLYLRIYREWGTISLSDIESEEGLFHHINGLWNSNIQQNGKRFADFSVNNAIDKVNKVLCKMKLDPMTLIHVLVDEDLLVPQQEFLQSLVEEQETDTDDVQLPETLISVWKVMICSIDAKVGAKCIINCLVDKINEEEDDTRGEYYAAWIVELTEGMLGRSDRLKLRSDHMCSEKDLEHWLATPNRLIETLLPCFANLTGISKHKFKLLRQLLAAADPEVDPTSNIADKNKRIYSLEDLNMIELEKTDQNQEDMNMEVKGDGSSKWKLEPGWRQEKQLFKMFDGQSWESLWLPIDCEWQEAVEGADLEDDLLDNQYDIEVGLTQWPNMEPVSSHGVGNDYSLPAASGNAEGDDSQVPHFYRNENYQEHSTVTPRRRYQRRDLSAPRWENNKRGSHVMPCPKRRRYI